MSNDKDAIPLLYTIDPVQILKGELLASTKRGHAAFLLLCGSLIFFEIISYFRKYEIDFISIIPIIYVPTVLFFLALGLIRAKKKNALVLLTDSALKIIRTDRIVEIIQLHSITKVFIYKTWINSHSLKAADLWVAIHFKSGDKLKILDLGPKTLAFFDSFIQLIKRFNSSVIVEDYVNGPHRGKSYKITFFNW